MQSYRIKEGGVRHHSSPYQEKRRQGNSLFGAEFALDTWLLGEEKGMMNIETFVEKKRADLGGT